MSFTHHSSVAAWTVFKHSGSWTLEQNVKQQSNTKSGLIAAFDNHPSNAELCLDTNDSINTLIYAINLPASKAACMKYLNHSVSGLVGDNSPDVSERED